MSKTKKCKNCGKEIDSKSLYCMNCGVANKKRNFKILLISFLGVIFILISIIIGVEVVNGFIILNAISDKNSNKVQTEAKKEESKTEWKQDSTGWRYIENNETVTGWKEIEGKSYYFDSNGYMVHDETIDNYYLSSDGSKIETLTFKQAEERVLNQVKKVRYSDNAIKLAIAYEPQEKTIEGKEGYFIRVSEDRNDHYTTPNNIFIDKHTGKLYDADELFLIIGDCKLQEFKKSHDHRALTKEGMVNAENNPLYNDIKETNKNTNSSNVELTPDEVKKLILQEDSEFIKSIQKREGDASLTAPIMDNKNLSAKSWNLPEDEYYESSLLSGVDEMEWCIYLVGKKSKNVYALPHQGGVPAYEIKNNQKNKTYYSQNGSNYEWR